MYLVSLLPELVGKMGMFSTRGDTSIYASIQALNRLCEFVLPNCLHSKKPQMNK